MELREHRARFAWAWQTSGPSPQTAHAVADAYRLESAHNAAPLSLGGKNSQEVATPLQAAPAKKDFMLANQMYVAYQRQQLRTTSEILQPTVTDVISTTT
ncbi:hypothetical protein [Rhodanobacter ginsengiterrae]|uniref:hypothetical protein n=1 Tax=Rhodanobacter ginsengiterrae TaxID=2008451 RepID=UPI003CEAEF97